MYLEEAQYLLLFSFCRLATEFLPVLPLSLQEDHIYDILSNSFSFSFQEALLTDLGNFINPLTDIIKQNGITSNNNSLRRCKLYRIYQESVKLDSVYNENFSLVKNIMKKNSWVRNVVFSSLKLIQGIHSDRAPPCLCIC